MGSAVALPFLDALVPALSAQFKAPLRFGVVYFPNGAIMNEWIPKTTGVGFEFPAILKPIEEFKDSLVLVNNLTRSRPGSVIGDHAVSAAGFLTGVWPKRTEAEDVLANTTIDQIIARKIGQETPLPSLEVATEDFTGYVGACSPGFSCAYMNTISWRTPTSPLPMETNPRTVFERLFGGGGTVAERQARLANQRSILDSIAEDAGDLQAGLGARDRARLSDYLDNLREIERRIQRVEARKDAPETALDAPVGVPDNYEEHVGLMYDLLAAAYQANISRVFTFMLSREISQRTFPQIGVGEQHHSVSHHQSNAEKMAKVVKINTYNTGLFAKFLRKLQATEDGDGSLLDHSLIVYGAGMGDSNGHNTDPLPVALLSGSLKGHRHIELTKRTPVGNLWRTVAARFDTPIEQFGDSTGIVDAVF
jgi:hypothetical protein